MICERLTVETDDTKLSCRFDPPAEEQVKALPKGQAKERRNSNDREMIHLRMMDLNLFRVFDSIMLHRSVRKASQVLSVKLMNASKARQPAAASGSSVPFRSSRPKRSIGLAA